MSGWLRVVPLRQPRHASLLHCLRPEPAAAARSHATLPVRAAAGLETLLAGLGASLPCRVLLLLLLVILGELACLFV